MNFFTIPTLNILLIHNLFGMNMNLNGMLIGVMSLVIIGVWHPIVIKSEYYLGKKISAVIFFISGAICCFISIFFSNTILSVDFALFGFSGFWGIKEVYEQEERVKKGWFPSNPNKK